LSDEKEAFRTTFHNAGNQPLTVWIEPWADDFTLLPGEEFDLYVPGLRRASQVCGDQWIQFYVENSSGEYDHWVKQNGIQLESGHNRQFSRDSS